MFLTGWLPLVGSVLFLIPLRYIVIPLPRSGTTHNGLNPPTIMINQENAPIDLPTRQSDGSNSSVEISSSQVTLVCQVEKNQHNCSAPQALASFHARASEQREP